MPSRRVGKRNPGDAEEATSTALWAGALPLLRMLGVTVRFLVGHNLAQLSVIAVKALSSCSTYHPVSQYYQVHGVPCQDSAHSGQIDAFFLARHTFDYTDHDGGSAAALVL